MHLVSFISIFLILVSISLETWFSSWIPLPWLIVWMPILQISALTMATSTWITIRWAAIARITRWRRRVWWVRTPRMLIISMIVFWRWFFSFKLYLDFWFVVCAFFIVSRIVIRSWIILYPPISWSTSTSASIMLSWHFIEIYVLIIYKMK